MDHLTYIMMMMMMMMMIITLAVCSGSLSELGFSITNGPQDTTVCMNDMAECTCGFDGADPLLTRPDWTIVTRSSSGSVISNVTIDGEDILINVHHGFKWILGPRNSTSVPGSKLIFGPVNKTHNQSSYQCLFNIIVNQFENGSNQFHSVKSSVGILTVMGPSIGNIVVDETCATSLSISWDTHIHPVCGVKSQLVTISSPVSGTRKFPVSDNNFTSTNLNSNTLYDVTVTLRYKSSQVNTTIKTSTLLATDRPGVSELKAAQVLNRVILVWMPPTINRCFTSEFQYYQVIVTTNERNNSSQRKTSKVTSSDTIIILSDHMMIQPNQLYTISVSAIYNEGSSPPLVIDFMIANDAIPNKDVKVDDDNNDDGDDDDDDDNQCSSMMIGFTVTIVVLVAITIGITAMMMWRLYKHRIEEAVIPKTQQLTTDTIKMQSSPAYAPMSQDNIKSSTVPQYETIQHCNNVRMDTNPAYLTHEST